MGADREALLRQPTREPFYAADLDGDSLAMEPTEDEHAKRSYSAFLTVLTENMGQSTGMYLDRRQAVRLRDFLNEALEAPDA